MCVCVCVCVCGWVGGYGSEYSSHALHRTLLNVASSRDRRHTLVEFVPHCVCKLV